MLIFQYVLVNKDGKIDLRLNGNIGFRLLYVMKDCKIDLRLKNYKVRFTIRLY
jgi:hypothetical protein